jgi:hypothetical protein
MGCASILRPDLDREGEGRKGAYERNAEEDKNRTGAHFRRRALNSAIQARPRRLSQRGASRK